MLRTARYLAMEQTARQLAWGPTSEAELAQRRRENPPKPLTRQELAELDERCRDFFGDD
jgi:hypothetical protein